MRLSKFIEMKLNCQYEDGNAFYEVTEKEESTEGDATVEEDLLYYKKVLRPKKEEVCVIIFHNNYCCTLEIPFWLYAA